MFACPEGPRIVVRVEGEQAAVFAPGQTYLLPHVSAASGARYSDGTATFWSKGEEAAFDLPVGEIEIQSMFFKVARYGCSQISECCVTAKKFSAAD